MNQMRSQGGLQVETRTLMHLKQETFRTGVELKGLNPLRNKVIPLQEERTFMGRNARGISMGQCFFKRECRPYIETGGGRQSQTA